MKRSASLPLLAVLSLALSAPVFAASSYFEGFDDDGTTHGWIPNTIGTDLFPLPGGGNPGGWLMSARNFAPDNMSIGATSELPQVSGDYAAAGITNVSFDVYYEVGQTYLAAAFRVRFQDPTFNGWYYPLDNDFAQGWHSYSIPLDPTLSDMDAVLAGWVQEDPTISFAQTFSNVYHPEIRIDGLPGVQLFAGIDNFRLTATTVDPCVEDTTGPTLEVTLDRDVLWPPNHKLVEICAEISVSDDCDDAPTVSLVSVTSDEADNGLGDGDTAGDIDVIDDSGDPPTCLNLRSERQGGGDGRVYTIIYCASDPSGNSTCDTVTVTVPHDQSGHAQAAAGIAPTGNDFLPSVTEYTLVIPSKGNFDARTVLLDRAFVGNEQGYVRPLTATLVDFDHDRDIDAVLTFDVAATQDIAGQSANSAQVSELDPVNMSYDEGDIIMAAAPSSGKTTPLSLLYETTSGETYLTISIFKLPRAEKPASSDPDDGVNMELGTTSTAQFALSRGGHTTVEIFNVLGQKLRTLVDQDLGAGSYRMPWDGRDDSGQKVSIGMYFVRIISPDVQQTTRIVLTR
jgi:hypothetical protein